MTKKKNHFCPVRILNRAAEIYQKHWKDFSLLMILLLAIGMLSGIGVQVNPITGKITRTTIGTIAYLVSWFAMIYFALAYTRFTLKVVDGKSVQVDRFFHEVKSVRHYLSYLITRFLVKFLTVLIFLLPLLLIDVALDTISTLSLWGKTIFIVALILLVFAAIVYSIALMFAPIAVAEGRAEIFESIKLSWKITKGERIKLLVLLFLTAFLNLVGVLAFGIGLFITIPISSIAILVAYRELLREKHLLHEKKHHEAE